MKKIIYLCDKCGKEIRESNFNSADATSITSISAIRMFGENRKPVIHEDHKDALTFCDLYCLREYLDKQFNYDANDKQIHEDPPMAMVPPLAPTLDHADEEIMEEGQTESVDPQI